MSDQTGIEWTDATWNPVRGCSRVSEGCRNCYAERVAARFSHTDSVETDYGGHEPLGRVAPFDGFAQQTKAGPRWTGRVELIPSKLDEPLRWRKPRRIFVNSMSDLFHEHLSDEAIAAVFGVMAACPQHTFQILTKRPERMRRWFGWILDESPISPEADFVQAAAGRHGLRFFWQSPGWPLPNVWLGTSVEDQATADERIPLLLQTPAAVRFVSYEPALGPVDFRRAFGSEGPRQTYVEQLDWIIVGGESGPGARPFDIAWARSARDQCKEAGVAFFMKQFGALPLYDETTGDFGTKVRAIDGFLCYSPHSRKGGDPSEWPEDLRVREFPRSARVLIAEDRW